MAPLTIYKASAGSGKTFQLTLGYLILLLKDPLAYRHILAVTFTNKAASEMKSRILERLYHLSRLKENDQSGDLSILIEKTELDRAAIIAKSGELLVKILNDYSRFSVGTIDKFFQGVIRAFAREIGLPAGFVLELDKNRILNDAVDRMFKDLGEDEELLKWMLRFADARIEDARGWNFRGEIVALGEELFTEGFQEVMLERETIFTRDQLKAFIDQLKEIGDSAVKTIRQTASEVLSKMSTAGYSSDDFLRKSGGLAGYFEKVLNEDRFSFSDPQKAGIEDSGKWLSVKESDAAKIELTETALMPAYRLIYEQIIIYKSVTEVNNHIYALGILGDLSARILDITDEKNMFLLSDASRFLRGLIGNNPTPFIYEKTGNFIDHIMLDEFQDTSVFQWDNFRPLLEHTMSTGKENIIVGDVKQSIYRWRNSDWKILAGKVSRSFGAHPVTQTPLEENWRSRELIIKFNNSLFKQAPLIIRSIVSNSMDGARVSNEFKERWNNLLESAYGEANQRVPLKSIGTEGYVRAEVLQGESKSQRELALEKIPQWIRELQDAGYLAGEIAILVRKNSEGADVAEQLMSVANNPENQKYNLSFVSNESLFLNYNPAIKFLICLITWLNDANNALNNLTLRYYFHYINGLDISNSRLNSQNTIKEVLGETFFEKITALKRLPLFELVENLTDIFSLDRHTANLPYIQAFQEVILEQQKENPGSLHDFLTYWNESGIKKSITVSEEQNAIRIITIHKAKGLQYKAVIVPFCDWDLTTSSTGSREKILWCSTVGTPFESVPVVPVKFKKEIGETFFAEYYIEELIMGYIDNLNMLYVALTRAEEAMIIGLPGEETGEKLNKSGQLVMKAASNTSGIVDNLTIDIAENMTEVGFEVGKLSRKETAGDQHEPSHRIDKYPVNFRDGSMRLRMKSKDYFRISDDERGGTIDFGNVMHELFRWIGTSADVETAIGRFKREGLIGMTDAATLKALVIEKISGAKVMDWYTDEWEIRNESEIFSEGEAYRPDRVMIKEGRAVVVDYKFGETEDNRYEKQVIKYCRLLESMSYAPVEGYLWFVMSDKTVKVY